MGRAPTPTAWVDPELAAGLGAVAVPQPGPSTLAAARAATGGAPAGPPPEGIERLELPVEGPGDVRAHLRIHRPATAPRPMPCVVFIHGGAFVMGSALAEDGRAQRWAGTLGCAVAAVEYRLAPETPYPAALEDCLGAVAFVHDHASELGVDPHRIGIAGSSAGGGLAAAVAIAARDRAGPPLCFQLLIYPMLDDTASSPSAGAERPVFSVGANHFGWSAYLGRLAGRPDVPASAAPFRASDLAGLPPALIVAAAADILFDEDVEYARRLVRAGVPTELLAYAGATHGFERTVPGAAVARRARRDIDGWLARAMGLDAG